MASIERVAIVGASGQIGCAIARAVIKSGRYTVTAITREGSKSTLLEGAKVIEVDYGDPQALTLALKGQQFLIITLSAFGLLDIHGKIVKAADQAGVSYIMPNHYGCDIQDPAIMKESMYAPTYKQRFSDLEGIQSAWLALAGKAFFGFDIANRSVTFFDDGKTKVDSSTWNQCGRAVAGFLNLPEFGDASSSSPPCLAHWKNKPLYINSFKVGQRDMLDSLHRVLGTTDSDWKIDFEPTEERFKRGRQELKNGNRLGFPTAAYARLFYPNGDGDFSSQWGTSNELLGLPVDDLDEATARAVKMAQNGWKPF